jgi:hypothetical protein
MFDAGEVERGQGAGQLVSMQIEGDHFLRWNRASQLVINQIEGDQTREVKQRGSEGGERASQALAG